MNSQELLEYLGKVSEENPLVEQEELPPLRSAYEELRQKASWIDAGVHGGTFTHEDCGYPGGAPPTGKRRASPPSSATSWTGSGCPSPCWPSPNTWRRWWMRTATSWPRRIWRVWRKHLPQGLVDQAVETIQSLDPPGVGARDLRSAWCCSWPGRTPSPAVMDIVARFLPELGRKHYGPISRELGLTTEEIQAAEKVIASLEPHPGQAFQAGRAHRLCTARCLYRGTGRKIAGDPQRLLPAPGSPSATTTPGC